MSLFPVPRQYRRFAPEPPVCVDFELEGQALAGVEVASFGAGGFGAWVEERHGALFETNRRLRDLRFHGLDAPELPAEARVVFSTLRGQSARPGWTMFGVEFLAPAPAFREAVEAMAGA